MEIDKAGVMGGTFSMFHFNTAWILELAEVDQFRVEGKNSTLKAWLTTPTDTGQRKGRNEKETIKRRFSVVGTTNQTAFADGEERRWLPVHHVKQLNHAELTALRSQLWAQILRLYRDGDPFRLNAIEAEWHREAVADQDIHQDDPWWDCLQAYVDSPVNTTTLVFSNSEIYDQLGVESRHRDIKLANRINAIMRKLGFDKHRRKTSRGFVRRQKA
jgi:predicted P-loop ATPase